MKITKSKEILFLLSLIIGMAASVDVVANVTLPLTATININNFIPADMSIFGVSACTGPPSSSLQTVSEETVSARGSLLFVPSYLVTITDVSVSTITSTSTVGGTFSYPRMTSWTTTTAYRYLPCNRYYDRDYSPKRRYNYL